MGHDPHRHGRFIIIVEQRENSLYKADKEDALGYIPKISYSVPDTMIFITISSVLEENKIRQSLKNLHLELDRIGRIEKWIYRMKNVSW